MDRSTSHTTQGSNPSREISSMTALRFVWNARRAAHNTGLPRLAVPAFVGRLTAALLGPPCYIRISSIGSGITYDDPIVAKGCHQSESLTRRVTLKTTFSLTTPQNHLSHRSGAEQRSASNTSYYSQLLSRANQVGRAEDASPVVVVVPLSYLLRWLLVAVLPSCLLPREQGSWTNRGSLESSVE